MNVEVHRTQNLSDGVFGIMTVGNTILHTMEEDWKDNKPSISCIPDGKYRLHRTVYHRGGYPAYEIMDVPGRSRILIHVANTEENVKGCIGVGTRRGFLTVRDEDDPAHPLVKKNAVIESKKAFKIFMEEMMGIEEATITITWADGLP